MNTQPGLDQYLWNTQLDKILIIWLGLLDIILFWPSEVSEIRFYFYELHEKMCLKYCLSPLQWIEYILPSGCLPGASWWWNPSYEYICESCVTVAVDSTLHATSTQGQNYTTANLCFPFYYPYHTVFSTWNFSEITWLNRP